MAEQNIHKNIGIEDESTWGASYAGTASRLTIISTSLGQDPVKQVAEDTQTTGKGRDRIVNLRNEVGGDIVGYGDVRNLHYFFESVQGQAGTSAGLGVTGVIMTYSQNTSGSNKSNTIVLDRNNTQEKFSGVRGLELKLSASNELMEATLSTLARSRTTGVSLADLGVTMKPFTFGDITLQIMPGATFVSADALTLQCQEWEVIYNNNSERSYLSGSRTAARIDPKVPELKGSFKIFHEGATWTDAAYGCSEFYMRITGNLPSCGGLIAGTTPYVLQIDLPRVQITTNVRNYEQAALSIETLEIVGLYSSLASCLWQPKLTIQTGIL